MAVQCRKAEIGKPTARYDLCLVTSEATRKIPHKLGNVAYFMLGSLARLTSEVQWLVSRLVGKEYPLEHEILGCRSQTRPREKSTLGAADA